MKQFCLIFLFFVITIFCYAQHEYDSIRYYSIINFIIDNQSLIKSYIADIDEKGEYDIKKLYINHNETGKIFCVPREFNNQLHKYYKDLKENELDLAIRKDYVIYTLEEIHFNREILKDVNSYLDSILRKGKTVDTSKYYWNVLFSDSFYDYKGVIIYNHNKLIHRYFTEELELVFLFDEQNRIRMVNICLIFK
jgi:chemotaxis regulatin CheY-phosphate phosphatase CheZ